ncbi:MAG: response regulator transcription factor [Bacteroides sp.]|nr:response regulator transcription factor [Roseburia sp.]MCM1346768.1 response regulator transcription factor [Bacteroides sp.]MCM1420446.1 response regulator transcription factor [Bacteroides sp.]
MKPDTVISDNLLYHKPLCAFIVDDNPEARNVLADDLKEMPEIGEVKCFSSYEEATLPLLETRPDILFLDVEMPGRNGLDFLESVQQRINFPIRVVFYTAFSSYMLDAIRHAAFDFLLKPYKKDELKTVIAKIQKECEEKKRFEAIYTNPLSGRKLAIQTVSELLLLNIDELLSLQYNKDSRSWLVTLTNETTHFLRKGVRADDLLALHPSLVRISSSCIINTTYLSAVENTTLKCRFCPPFNHIEMVASRRYFSKLKEMFEMI